MFEIILLILVTGGVASFARSRGGKLWLRRTLAGYFLGPFVVTFFAVVLSAYPKGVKENAELWFFVSAVAWVAVLAFCARLLLGGGYAKPHGMFLRPTCTHLAVSAPL